jgi:hypothetical protein
MTKLPVNDKEIEDPSLIEEAFPRFAYDVDFAYREALEKDIVATARKLVNACRASGQRREALENVIVEGNEKGWFQNEQGQVYSLEILVLLRDVDTRWSSILYMIDRLIVDYPVCAARLELKFCLSHSRLSRYFLNDLSMPILLALPSMIWN